MGRGIAQVCAMAGYNTVLTDISEDTLRKAHKQILSNLEKGVARGKVYPRLKNYALQNFN